jgi:RHS repeat-associated protein
MAERTCRPNVAIDSYSLPSTPIDQNRPQISDDRPSNLHRHPKRSLKHPETGPKRYTLNRYYDPATSQFLSVDPLVDITQQPYQYVGDDPLNGTDPTGLFCGGPLFCPVTHAAKAVASDTYAVGKVGGAIIGWGATYALGGATDWLDNHLTVSGSICVIECTGLQLQDGTLYLQKTNGLYFGASVGIGYSSNSNSSGGSSLLGVGPGSLSWSGSGWSASYGPGAVFGYGHSYLTPIVC